MRLKDNSSEIRKEMISSGIVNSAGGVGKYFIHFLYSTERPRL